MSEVGAPKVAQPLTLDERRAQGAELISRLNSAIKTMATDKKKRAADMLLAAGYSPDQVEWLSVRLEGLRKERNSTRQELLARGLPMDPVKSLAHMYNQDIELRYEIGDDEYERYLLALDRPTNVHATTVLPGSIADTFGIRTGDVILSYDNKRLFNQGELDGLAIGTSGRSAAVTVNRDGEILNLVVPGGPFGVKSSDPGIGVETDLSP